MYMCVCMCILFSRKSTLVSRYLCIDMCSACVRVSPSSDVCQYTLNVCAFFQEQQLREVEDRIDVLTVCMRVCVYAVS
jgi:hypothetical protein